MCNKHVLNMNSSVNSVHNCLKVTTRHRTANLYSLKKKIGEPEETNISTIITHYLGWVSLFIHASYCHIYSRIYQCAPALCCT